MKKARSAFTAAGFVALALTVSACELGFAPASAPGASTPSPEQAGAAAQTAGKAPIAVLETTQGAIKIKFFPDKAPEHVRNFIELAKAGMYDGTYFHRVFQGFMIQGGDFNSKDSDPRNDGGGGYSYKGPGTTLRAEFNDTPHERGIVSMARTMDVNGAGSQFFIMVAANRSLDRQYTAFGQVVEGMDVVDRIVKEPGTPIPGAGGVNPYKHQYINKVRIEE